jgi:hypothetical protein
MMRRRSASAMSNSAIAMIRIANTAAYCLALIVLTVALIDLAADMLGWGGFVFGWQTAIVAAILSLAVCVATVTAESYMRRR